MPERHNEDDSDIPMDVRQELMRCATANGQISYYYLCAVYRQGRQGVEELQKRIETLQETNRLSIENGNRAWAEVVCLEATVARLTKGLQKSVALLRRGDYPEEWADEIEAAIVHSEPRP